MTRTLCCGLFALCLFVIAGATPSGGRLAAAERTPEAEDGLQPLLTTSELVVGSNRFAFGLLKAHTLLDGADVTVRVYTLQGAEAHVVAEYQALYHPLRPVQQAHADHPHAEGTAPGHDDAFAVQGLYVAQVHFAQAGTWGIALRAWEGSGPVHTVHFAVVVRDTPATPALGTTAPRSRNLIASDVTHLRAIDTSPEPDARLHQVRIAEAIDQGRPQLIVFATPQFCTSRMCGSVVDLVRTLVPAYAPRVAFTYQEFWQDFAMQQVFPTVDEWHLETEPWIFVVDGQGIIRAKFEGLVTVQELENALQQLGP